MIRHGFPDSESRQDLIELARDGSAAHRLARRANALVLLDDGMSCEAIAKVLLLDDGTIPRLVVWVSDMLGSQRGHGVEWQVCLAHVLRDARYAVECGDIAFSAAFKRLLLRSIAIGRRRDTLKDTTLKQYHADLDRRLDRIMAPVPIGEPGRKLRKRIAANRGHLFVFITNRSVPSTNNVSERNLRPSVIFRKVTNGFRCERGAETYAAFRSVVSTANANRASVLAVLQFVLAAKLPLQPLAQVG